MYIHIVAAVERRRNSSSLNKPQVEHADIPRDSFRLRLVGAKRAALGLDVSGVRELERFVKRLSNKPLSNNPALFLPTREDRRRRDG